MLCASIGSPWLRRHWWVKHKNKTERLQTERTVSWEPAEQLEMVRGQSVQSTKKYKCDVDQQQRVSMLPVSGTYRLKSWKLLLTMGRKWKL